MEVLSKEFEFALSNVEVSTGKQKRAQQAQLEVREVLEADATLCDWGVDTVLIGSYVRHTSIHPGKDVDVFSKLDALDTTASPTTVYNTMRDVLVRQYGKRAEPQHRSIKILFDTDDGFSVDAVPAVHCDARWAIPNRDVKTWEGEGRWVETDPEKLTALTIDVNKLLTVSGQGAYVPIVKLVRQTRRHHLGDAKPGGLYFEIMSYWIFVGGLQGSSWAEIFSATLRGLERILGQARQNPVLDPVLDRPFEPQPDEAELRHAHRTYEELASKAELALRSEACPAAVLWRSILGTNERGQVFPLPDGCDEEGHRISPISSLAGRGSREASSFGRHWSL